MLREYKNEDYSAISEWAAAQYFPILPPEYLPKHGLVVENTCVGFLYQTDSRIAWMEWIITNPLASSDARNQGLNALISGLLDIARTLEVGAVFTSVEHPGLISRYSEMGFVKTDSEMTNMIRRIN